MEKSGKGRNRIVLFLSYFFAAVIILFSLILLFFSETLQNRVFSGNAIDSGYECGTYVGAIPGDAIASSTFSSAYSASKANDGDGATSWISLGKNESHWISFDLGAVKCINRIVFIVNRDYTPMTLDVEVSDDRITWEKVYLDKAIPAGGSSAIIDFNPIDGRYVRIYEKQTSQVIGPASIAGSGASLQKFGTLAEIQVRMAPRTQASQIVITSGSGTPPDSAVAEPAGGRCIDSDKSTTYPDGKNLGLKGATDARPGGGALFNDRCIVQESSGQRNLDECDGNNCRLQEGFCTDSGQLSIENYTCEFGCDAGKCLSTRILEDTEEEIDLSELRIANGYDVQVKLGNTYYIPYDDFYHFSKILDINSLRREVTVYFDALYEDLVIRVGEIKNVDLDLDGEDDISLKLNRIINSDNAEIHYALIKDSDVLVTNNAGNRVVNNRAGGGNIGGGGAGNTGGANVGGPDRGIGAGSGASLNEKITNIKQGGNDTEGKTGESKGFWGSLSENTQLAVIVVVLFIVLITALIVAYIITSKS